MAFEIEKTHYFTLDDGTNIPVSQLPESIKDQVKIFDEIRDNIVQKSFEAQVYQLAGEQKKVQLQKMLQNYVDAQKTADAANEEHKKSNTSTTSTRTKKTSKKKASESIEPEDN